MASKIKVDQIEGSAGSSITIPSGQTLTITDGLAASTIGSGTLADARIPNLNASKINAGTIPIARGGTGLTSLGTATHVLRTNAAGNALEFAAAEGGGVKQLKQTLKTSSFTSSSGSYVDVTGLSVTITPSSASNRILVMCNASLTAENQAGGLGYLKMIRNVGGGGFSELAESTDSGSYTHGHAEIEFNTAYGHVGSVPLNFLYFDNPNTTSAVIYKMSAKTNGSGTMVLGRSGRADTSSQDIKHATQLIAMEIDGGIL